MSATKLAHFPLFLSVACLLASICSAGLALMEKPVAASLTITPEIFDFGSTTQGEVIPVKFQIRNSSRASIILEGPLPSCSCVEATISNTELAPGQMTEVSTTFTSGRRRGKVSTDVDIRYREGADSPIFARRLMITGEVLSDFNYTPNALSFTRGQQSTHTIILSSTKRLQDLDIHEVRSNRSYFLVSSPKRDTATGDWHISIVYQGDRLLGDEVDLGAQITVLTNSKLEPTLLIPVSFVK